MPVLWNKLDSSLSSRYGSYLRGGVDQKLLVSLFYEGDLAGIEAAGFETVYRGGPQGYATGKIQLSGLEQIAGAPGVVRISFGQERRPNLNQSVPLIHARPEVWEWDAAQNKFVGVTGKGTGKDVVVGIIDTGIDWQHPFFLLQGGPVKTTRIRSIWDQGLGPDGDEGATSPNAGLLSGLLGTTFTYGVEYNFARIQAALNNGPSIRHRDCWGHGTHVASIAAGNGGPARNFVGVAPEADLIVVKTHGLQSDPVHGDAYIGFDVLLADAVCYILNKAAALNKPAVINLSLGSSLGPHDGFTTSEDWLTKTFDAQPKRCFVVAAGNEAAGRMHAVVKFTAAGAADLHIELKDLRAKRETYTLCRCEDATPFTMDLHIYYPPDAGPITVQIKPKGAPDSAFQDGPARDVAKDPVTIDGFKIGMTHVLEVQPRDFTQSPPVRRSKFVLQMIGKTDAAGKHPRYLEGDYTLRITAPAALTAHVWMDQFGDTSYLKVINPVAPEVLLTDAFLISSPGGSANVVTVAAYNPTIPTFPTYGFSSRGPLVNYASDTAPHPVEKPDVSAPGETIDAAASREVHARSRARKNAEMVTVKDGTSMAAPHVTGVVALMFENNPNLTSTEILNILRTDGNDPVPVTQKLEQGEGRVDAKKAFDKAPNP